MRSPLGVFIFVGIMLLLDFYFFQALKTIAHAAQPRYKAIFYAVYWGISVLAIICFLLFVILGPDFFSRKVRSYMIVFLMGLFLAKFIGIIFFFIDDLRRAIQWLATKLFYKKSAIVNAAEDGISRSVFLSWVGMAAGTTLFGSMLYGMTNRYKYKVRNVDLNFPNLPASFKGLKLVQISDIHSGSFTDPQAVAHGIDTIMEQKPDLIIFTGDLVNDQATEMEDYIEMFSRLKAPMGVYSVLGNHDYGDYVQWPIKGITKNQNLENLKKIHAAMGWRLLLNEHVVLKKGEDEIALLGVENWSNKARFPKHGRMDLAHAGTEKYPFKILMSHDPSHWEGQIKPQYADVDLMLSGHTHGMQFGVEIPGFKWSPVQYVYKQWAGLYETQHQKLYVNRGFGFIGYPGRVGILAEITVLNLT